MGRGSFELVSNCEYYYKRSLQVYKYYKFSKCIYSWRSHAAGALIVQEVAFLIFYIFDQRYKIVRKNLDMIEIYFFPCFGH